MMYAYRVFGAIKETRAVMYKKMGLPDIAAEHLSHYDIYVTLNKYINQHQADKKPLTFPASGISVTLPELQFMTKVFRDFSLTPGCC